MVSFRPYFCERSPNCKNQNTYSLKLLSLISTYRKCSSSCKISCRLEMACSPQSMFFQMMQSTICYYTFIQNKPFLEFSTKCLFWLPCWCARKCSAKLESCLVSKFLFANPYLLVSQKNDDMTTNHQYNC